MVKFARTADDVPVSRKDAEKAWAQAAVQVLTGVACSYHAVIEYAALAQEVQERTGISTKMGQQNWIGSVLGRVARANHVSGLPPLTSLVVRSGFGMVGEGYDLVLELAGQQPLHDPVEREDHAALARLDCYKWAGVMEPTGGWKPALAPALQAARERAVKASLPVKPIPLCPNCRVALPATGHCDDCS